MTKTQWCLGHSECNRINGFYLTEQTHRLMCIFTVCNLQGNIKGIDTFAKEVIVRIVFASLVNTGLLSDGGICF